jgi:transketolase
MTIDLKDKAAWVRQELLEIHKTAPETRLASSLSDVEIFVALYYGGILEFDPKDIFWRDRDRFIASKGHGAVSLYPILADLGFFDEEELTRVCQSGSFMGGIPDCAVPGFESVNGALGHGPGVGCGIALALRSMGVDSKVVVLVGDGELHEGSIWEAVMFAGHHKMGNLMMVVDNNRTCMLDRAANVIANEPLSGKFEAFGWSAGTVDGHDVYAVQTALKEMKADSGDQPKILIADTIKGKGVPRLESDPLSHIKSLDRDEVELLVREIKCQ